MPWTRLFRRDHQKVKESKAVMQSQPLGGGTTQGSTVGNELVSSSLSWNCPNTSRLHSNESRACDVTKRGCPESLREEPQKIRAAPNSPLHANYLVSEILQCGMGFTMDQAEAAVRRCSSLERCIEWILARGEATSESPVHASVVEEETRGCGICYCDEAQSQMILCECQPKLHWVCHDCLRNWCHTKIDSHEVLVISCPHGFEGCQPELPFFTVSSVIDEPHREKYERLLMEKDWAQNNAHVVHCPACNFMTEWSVESQIHSITCQNMACETKSFCGKCGMIPHYREGDPEMNMDCSAYAKWKAENDGANQAFADYIVNNKVQTCPKCKEGCEKQSGCNFMYCKCKAMFCLHCGQSLEEKDHFSHFGKFGPYGQGCLNRAG